MIKTLFKVEWRKISRNRVFWAMLGLSLAALIAALLGLQSAIESTNSQLDDTQFAGISLLPTNIFIFPHIWHNIAFIGKYLKIFLGVVMIILVTNEYTYNTLRQNLITGLSKTQLIGSKVIDALLLAGVSTLILFVFGLIMGTYSSEEFDFSDIFRKINYLAGYFVAVLGFLSFAMMIAFIVKKSAFSIMILLVYSYILEQVPALKYSETFGSYLPLSNFNALIEAPDIPIFQTLGISNFSIGIPMNHLALAFVYLGVFWGISLLIIKRRDL